MQNPTPDPQFNAVINNGWTDDAPYNEPAAPVKPGLTPRGKAALAIGGAVLAGGSLVGYQSWAADQAATDLAARELALEERRLEIEEMKAQNAAAVALQEAQSETDTARQKAIAKCVDAKEKKVDANAALYAYRNIVDACTAIHGTVALDDAQPAAAITTASNTSDTEGGDGMGTGTLLGVGALGAAVLVFTRKARKTATD